MIDIKRMYKKVVNLVNVEKKTKDVNDTNDIVILEKSNGFITTLRVHYTVTSFNGNKVLSLTIDYVEVLEVIK